ncbi:phage tail protein [Devosia ginsengisoli]|uniref:Uncharacterized protein n=1 Tax=Devosia ginsengisoli TaxID=400770 RepID=A0A5B8LS83_9HYPH|nr:phage tail protein [Devosia ginsengisoli]QDZ10514.1 hypothetical protein FPZ08_06975 [Devosia ginsengisoli]
MDPFSLVIQLVVGLVLSLASTLLKQAFSRPQDQKTATGTRGTVSIGGRVPQSFLIGTVADAGKLEYRNAWGNDGEVPNAYLTDVYSFGDLPVTGMAGIFVNGIRRTVSGTGVVAQGNPVVLAEDGGTRRLWRKFFDGAQTTADSYLVSKFGSDADRAWTSDMIGRGVPVLITTALWSETTWTGFPSFVGEFQGIKLYDPRQDSTAGGSGSQRWDDPSTWAFSDNNLVIVYNIERGIHYSPAGATTLGAHIWGGRKTAAQLPYDAWAAAMDACDLAINLKGGGTEKQFRGGRKISLNERPADVIKDFLIGANARICHGSDGTVWPLVGVPDEADFSFTDADVLATEELGSIPFPNLDEIINGATATYREPSQAWEDKETAPYYRSDLEEEDDGRRQVEGLSLETTFSGTQAQRILKAVVEEGRRFGRHVVALPAAYAQFRPLQVGAWTSDRFGYSGKKFLITVRTRPIWGWVVFGLQEIDAADHDWNPETDEQPLSFAPVVTNRPAPQEVSGFSVAPGIAVDSDGVSRRPAIDVFWSSASVTVDVRAVRITIRLAADEIIVWEGEAPRPELGEARIIQALLPNEDYEVQIQYVPFSGRVTVESSWIPVTTPNVKLGPDDIDITFADIAAEIVEDLKWISEGVRSSLDNFERFGSLLSEQDLANFNDREVLKRELRKKVGDLEASFVEIIEVALGPNGAIANALSSLYAAMGGNSAQVMVRMGAEATPVGVEARWGMQLSTDGETFGSAAFLAQINTDGESQLVLDADRTVISTDGGTNVVALFNSEGAVIRDMTVGTIKSADGQSFWNLTTGEFQISSS